MAAPRLPMSGRQTASLAEMYDHIESASIDRRFIRLYLRELSRVSKLANLDRAILTAQSSEETSENGVPWASEVWRSHHNPAGMKTASGKSYIKFKSPEQAAQAQATHMCAYVYGECPPLLLPYLELAPRFDIAVEKYGGTVRYLDQLGNGRWAEDPKYADKILQHYNQLRSGNDRVAITYVSGCPNQGLRTMGSNVGAIVYHITNDDNFDGTRSWFLTRGSNASSHYVVDRDGRVYQFVEDSRQSWTNNDVRFPRRDIPNLNRILQWAKKGLPYSVNDWTISIEHVCRRGEALTEIQYVSSIKLSRNLVRKWAIVPSRGTLLRHSDINGCSPSNGGCNEDTGRWYCPGTEFNLERIITACGGDPQDMGA